MDTVLITMIALFALAAVALTIFALTGGILFSLIGIALGVTAIIVPEMAY